MDQQWGFDGYDMASMASSRSKEETAAKGDREGPKKKMPE